MAAPRASQPGSKVVSIYIPADLWDQIRRHVFDQGTSASALAVQLYREHLDASPAEQEQTLKGAREITMGRRRRRADP